MSARVPLVLVAAALVLAVAGCGGSGGGASTTTTTAATTAPTTQGNGSRPNSTTNQGSTTTEPTVPHTYSGAPRAGSKAPAPGVPVSKGGDNSIQLWGLEASAAERAQVTAIVHAYLDARAAANWTKACSYLAAKPRREFEQGLQGGAKRGIAACAVAMGALAQSVPQSAFADEARISRVLSLRIGRKYAFLIYTRPHPRGATFATALQRQGGAWKVVSVGPTRLGS